MYGDVGKNVGVRNLSSLCFFFLFPFSLYDGSLLKGGYLLTFIIICRVLV